MATYPPPANEQGSIFNPDSWIQQPLDSVDTAFLDANYCRYPVAQGNMNFSTTTNAGNTTINSNLILDGTYLTNYIEFPDGSQQFVASGGGVGDALLSGGTSSAPQTFTGYNEFDNANGRITLGNTTDTTKIKLEADADQNDQLNINGQVSIGNPTNGNTVIINSDGTTNNQLDVNGGLQINGTVYPILMETYSTTDSLYGLQVSGGGLFLGSNGGSTSSSTFVQLACLDGGDNQLYVGGSIQFSNSTLTGTNVTISSGSTGLVLSSGIQIKGNCVLSNLVSSTQSTSTLSQSTTTVETVQFSGNLQLFGGTTNRTISLNYSGQNDIEIYQNYSGNFETNSGLTISPNIETYPSNTNRITLYADATTNNQLDVEGNLNITGNFVGATSSGSPTVFTGYNQINGLITNGISCLQKIKGNVTYASGQGSIWTFVIPTTFGFGFSFAFSTNFTPDAYTVVNSQVLTSQSNSCISGIGYATSQPYILSGTTFFAYLLGLVAFSGTTSLISQTSASSTGGVYTIQTNDNPNYYQTNNISMELYIYPQAII